MAVAQKVRNDCPLQQYCQTSAAPSHGKPATQPAAGNTT